MKVCIAESSCIAAMSHEVTWVELAFPLVCSTKHRAAKTFVRKNDDVVRTIYQLGLIQENFP